MSKKALLICLAPAVLVALSGCSSSRDVEVTGTVQGASSSSSSLYVQFFELQSDGNQSIVHDLTLAGTQSFDEKVPLDGDKVLVRVIADSDGDQACTAGELWGEVQADVTNDKASADVTLSAAPCPTN